MAAALFIGADDAELCLASGLSLGAGGIGVFSLMSAAAAETAMTHHAPMIVQAGSSSYPGGSLTGLFQSGGWLGGFAAGLIGSGLLGLLFGRGLIGELGSIPSYFGLLFQLLLWGMLCRLIWTRWRGRDVGAPGVLSPRQLADPYLRSPGDLHGGRDADAGADSSEPHAAERR